MRPKTGMLRSGNLLLWTLAGLLLGTGLVRGQTSEVRPPDVRAGKPFRRAILFAGLGPDAIVHLGIYDAAIDAGYPPDVIIGTSGGSLAAAMVSGYPDRQQRHALLASREFHEYLLSPCVARNSPYGVMVQSLGWMARRSPLACRPPKLFCRPVITIPVPKRPAGMEQPFPMDNHRPRVIMVAGELTFGPERAVHADGKYYYETWFTDEQTARFLPQASAIGSKYPRSAIHVQAKVVTGVSMAKAARASSSEPYSFRPYCLAGKHYTGAAINLFPLELAQSIAHEVIVPRSPPTNRLQDTSGYSAFRYSAQHRQNWVDNADVTFRVHLRDKAEVLKGITLFPQLRFVTNKADLQAVSQTECEQRRMLWCPRPLVVDNVPEDHEEFLGYVRAMWEFGYQRGMQVFSQRKLISCE